jgi:undecaprenyl-diphosphatase
MDFLSRLDVALFYFINHTLQNRVFDAVMPWLTDLNKEPVVLVLVGLIWLALVVRGSRTVRLVALLLVPTILFTDQFNSSFVKHVFDRVRPCHALPDVRLLVSCGSGWSFPSSHAVNNFAGAVVIASFFRRSGWGFLAFAAVVAFSRVYVGVHYPSDVIGGALLGAASGWMIVWVYRKAEAWWHERNNAQGAR